MQRKLLPIFALLLALPAGAGTEMPVSPSEFRDYAEGYTLYFENDGEPAGAEAFGSEGEAMWQTPEGICVVGLWRPYDDKICFYYGIGDDVQCWRVLRDAQGLLVRQVGEDADEPDLTYRITRRDRKPLLCSGPGAQT